MFQNQAYEACSTIAQSFEVAYQQKKEGKNNGVLSDDKPWGEIVDQSVLLKPIDSNWQIRELYMNRVTSTEIPIQRAVL